LRAIVKLVPEWVAEEILSASQRSVARPPNPFRQVLEALTKPVLKGPLISSGSPLTLAIAPS
jgi:hypothetical protein